MVQETKTTIKSYFERNKKPTEAQFVNLIDSYQDANTALDSIVAISSAANTTAKFVMASGNGTFFTTARLNQIDVSGLNVTRVSADELIAATARITGGMDVSGTFTTGQVRDHHYYYTKDVSAGAEDWVRDTPYAFTGVFIRAQCKAGDMAVQVRLNTVSIVSANVGTTSVSANASANFVVGDDLDINIVSASACSGVSIFYAHDRAL